MWWTVVLVSVSALGIWLAPRTWVGWLITTLSEVIWLAYAITLHSTSLEIMSVMWFALHGRGMIVTYRKQHASCG